MGGVERDGRVDGLQASVDAADDVCPGGGALGGDPGGCHGGWGHGGMDAGGDYAAAVVEGPDTGDAVGAVVDGWAEGGGERGHMVWGEGGVGWAEGFFEDIEGARDGEPFVEGDSGRSFEVEILGGCVGAGDLVVAPV